MKNTMLNISLNLAKNIVLIQELQEYNKITLNQEFFDLGKYVREYNQINKRISNIKTYEELIYYVMEDSDMCEQEAKNYISGLVIESRFMYN